MPYLSVAENIFLNREPRRIAAIGMVDFGLMKREAERLLADLGVHIRGDTKVSDAHRGRAANGRDRTGDLTPGHAHPDGLADLGAFEPRDPGATGA